MTVLLPTSRVAHKPWRASQAEAALTGAPATEENFRRAAEEELKNAKGYEHNAFKIELAKTSHRRRADRTGGKRRDGTMSVMQKIMETVVGYEEAILSTDFPE